MDEDEKYVPPKAAFRLMDFIQASVDEVAAKTVDCGTCPVNMLCENSEGGTGYVCEECNATAVFVQELQPGERLPSDVLLLDCGEHKFKKRENTDRITKCAICSGAIMEKEVLNEGVKHHYIYTTHAKLTVGQRQKTLSFAAAHWKEHHAAKKAAKGR